MLTANPHGLRRNPGSFGHYGSVAPLCKIPEEPLGIGFWLQPPGRLAPGGTCT
ncbi:MAG: hypothetical protein ACFB2W_26965 [Leptolyngbyaceae cyanobacterium]